MITINVITIVRNDSVGLRRTWESLSSQTLAPNKWIIIDGASTDNTSEVIGEIGGSAFVVSEPDDGIYDAMNKGLSASRKFKSDYVVFMNAGDEFYEQSTLDLVSKSLSLLNPAPDLFYGDCVWAGTGVQHLKKARSHRFIYYGMFASHQSMYFKSTSISYLSYDDSLRVAGDYDFVSRLHVLGCSYFYSPRALCVFHDGGVSASSARKGRDENWSIQKSVLHIPWFGRLIIKIIYLLSSFGRTKLSPIYGILRYVRKE